MSLESLVQQSVIQSYKLKLKHPAHDKEKH